MKMKEYLDILSHNFPGEIKDYRSSGEEIYFEVRLEKVPAVAVFIQQKLNGNLVSMFAGDERVINGGNFSLYYVFAQRREGLFIIIKSWVPEKNPVFPSITKTIHTANLYEREIKDLFGLYPDGHPDLRSLVFHNNWPENLYPLRKDCNLRQKPPIVIEETEFTGVQGEGVYEIPVGPVHAGIIEPGHFRFSVAGEPIINLETQLFYVHKGIEKLCEGQSIEKCLFFAERTSGDETFSNSLAYCQAIEKIAGVTIPERAQYSRVIFAELERLVSHLGDLAGICLDVAYGFAAFQFRLLRGWTYQAIEEVGGSRFLRSVNKLGGLRKDFLAGYEEKLVSDLELIKKELADTVEIIKANSLFIDRVEHTGVLTRQTAVDLNAVGPAGRASGVCHDLRKDIPYAAYNQLQFEIPEHSNGDVNCRMNVKIEECFTAIDLVRQALQKMPAGAVYHPVNNVEPYLCSLGYTESPRGENIHWIMTGPDNTIFRYKIRTPSFCNWPALCHAVKGNVVPDFPLINKSFNLSYAGNDL